MSGIIMMLKSFGIDPEKMKLDAEGFIKKIEDGFDTIERRLDDIEQRLKELETRKTQSRQEALSDYNSHSDGVL